MSKCFIMLGMHRSATSLVSEGMKRMPNVHWPVVERDATPPGLRWVCENLTMASLNRQILQAAGGDWRHPPEHGRIVAQADAFEADIREAVALVRGGAELWGWKDPRNCLTAELYLPWVENPHLVAVFREPLESAMSLSRAYGVPDEEALALVREYDRRIVDLLRRFGSQPKWVRG